MPDWLKKILAVLVFLAVVAGEYSLFLRMGKKDQSLPVSEAQAAENVRTEIAMVNRLDLNSNRYAHPYADGSLSEARITVTDFEKVLENDCLELWIRQANGDIRIVSKANGYVWGGIEESTTNDLNKRWKKVAGSLLTVDYLNAQLVEETVYSADEKTERSWERLPGEVVYRFSFPAIGLSMECSLILEDNSLILRLPDGKLKEDPAYPVTAVTFLPFFGTARLDEINGYFLLPDGCGALMRFTEGKEYISSYSKRVYGNDLGIESAETLNGLSDVATRPIEYMIPRPEVMMPVYGVVHGPNENAFLTIIGSGAEYAQILADPASPRMNYHYIRTRFIYRETYIQPTSQNGTGVRVVQQARNDVNPSQCYTFLCGDAADYSGMAEVYRAYLEERNILSFHAAGNEPVLNLNVIAAVRDRGMLSNSTLLATSADKAREIIETLAENGLGDTLYTLEGVYSGGSGGYNLKHTALEKAFSDGEGLKALQKLASENGGQIALRFDPVRMTKDQSTFRTDIATKISQQPIRLAVDNDSLLFTETWYRKNSQIADCIRNAASLSSRYGIPCAASGIGEILFSDYQYNDAHTRTEAMNVQKKAAAEAGIRVLKTPYAYIWENTSAALQMPMEASQYLYMTDTVPFLQMVLHGSMTLYGSYLNEDGISPVNILRCIEYGQYPSFIITEADNYSLRDSALTEVYSSSWDTLRNDVTEISGVIKEALKGLGSARMTAHDALDDGLVRVTYENGTRIYINYGVSEKQADGYHVAGQSYLRVSEQ